METIFKQIEYIIKKSSLSDEDKLDLISNFKPLSNEELEEIANLFIQNEECISSFNELYKRKKEAVVNQDPFALKKILEEEFQMIKKYYESELKKKSGNLF